MKTSLAIALLLFPAWAWGQTNATQKTRAADNQKEIAEDLAVLATIVRENLIRLYPHSNDKNVIPQPTVEYYPGFGVVLQVQVPAPDDRPRAVPAPLRMSRWEQTRRRLRGEKIPLAKNCRACHANSDILAERQMLSSFRLSTFHQVGKPRPHRQQLVTELISTLAKNGASFRHLPATERIALTVAFRQSEARAARSMFKDLHHIPSTNKKTKPAKSTRLHVLQSSADLQFQQRKYTDAIKTFNEALTIARKTKEDGPAVRQMQARLIAAYLQLGDVERAMKSIQGNAKRDSAFIRRIFLDLTGLPPTTAQLKKFQDERNQSEIIDYLLQRRLGKQSRSSRTGRQQITVSATKNDLNQVQSGDISRAQFDKRVRRRGS